MTKIASFEAPRDSILTALQSISSVASNNKLIPILNHVKIEVAAGYVTMTGTDLETCIITTFDADVETPGAFTVNASLAQQFFSKLPRNALVSVSCDDDQRVEISFGNSIARPNSLEVADFPVFANDVFEADITIPAENLNRALSKVQSSISTEETQYYLNGVYLHKVDGRMTAVATDGKRFARSIIDIPSGADFPPIIVPRAYISDIAKLCDTDSALRFQASATKVRFEVGRTSITSKVIDATYPDYARIIPKSNIAHVSVDAREFASAIDRVTTLASDKVRAVVVEIDDGRMVLTLPRSEFGAAREELPCDYVGPAIRTGFAKEYLSGVSKLIEAENLDLYFDSEQPGAAPLICKDASDPRAFYMITPYRV